MGKTGGEGFTTSFARKSDIQQKCYLRLEALLGGETQVAKASMLEMAEAPVGKVVEPKVAKPVEVTTPVAKPRSAPVQSLDAETTIDESTSLSNCKLVVLGLNACRMVQSIATESGTSSKKYNMHAAIKDLLKASEERGKIFEISMEKGWSLIAKLVEKLDSGARADRENDEDVDISENEKMRRQSLAGNCASADVPRLRNHPGNLTRRPERDAQVEVSCGLG